jgi:hypothetical protein
MHTSSRLLTCAALAAAVLVVPRAIAAGPPVNVIVSQHNTIASLSASELKKVVSGGTKVWGSGAVVQLGIIPGEAAETQGLASLLDTTPRELLSVIQQQVFKGDLRRPVVLRSSSDCMALAASNPGAVCAAAAGTPVPDGARIVPIR